MSDFDISERTRQLGRRYRQQNNLDYRPAKVLNDGTSIYDPAIPGNIFVVEQAPNGLTTKRSVRPPQQQGLILKPGKSVRLEYDNQGQLFIAAIDTRGALASGENPIPPPALPPPSAQNTSFALAVIPTLPASLSVIVRAWNPIFNNVVTLFGGATVDLTASVPSAGQMRLAAIFVKNDYATTEVVNSTARGVADMPLDATDINECLAGKSSGSTAVIAVKLIGGQTTITQDNLLVDSFLLRQDVNTPDRSSTVRVITAAGAVTVTTADYTIAVNKSVGAATAVNLPASPATGLTFVIKDLKGDANTNNITLTPAAGNIDGVGTYVMNVARQSRIIQYTGSEWSIIGGYL